MYCNPISLTFNPCPNSHKKPQISPALKLNRATLNQYYNHNDLDGIIKVMRNNQGNDSTEDQISYR